MKDLDELIESIADKCYIYGEIPVDDHPTDCNCRICFVIGLKEEILEAAEPEIKGKVLKMERLRIADYLKAKYGGVGRNASRTAMYAVAKDLSLDLTLRGEEII